MNRTLRTGVVFALSSVAVGMVLTVALWNNRAPVSAVGAIGGTDRPGESDVSLVRASEAITDRAYLPAVVQGSPEWNLLRNANLEGTYVQFANFRTAVVAPEWLPWWKPQGADDPAWKNRMPTYGPATGYLSRIHSGWNAQHLFTDYGTHVAGVYQRVHGVPPAGKLRFSIWGQAWAGTGDDPSRSVGGGPMHMRVGIDPSGGSDPFSTGIVWSAEQNPLDGWSLFVVEAWAQANEVTVYTWSAPDSPTKHNEVWWDDAALTLALP